MAEGIVHDLGPILGVELLGHSGRTGHVAKQDRDGAPFALHGAPRAACRSFGAWFRELGHEGLMGWGSVRPMSIVGYLELALGAGRNFPHQRGQVK